VKGVLQVKEQHIPNQEARGLWSHLNPGVTVWLTDSLRNQLGQAEDGVNRGLRLLPQTQKLPGVHSVNM
jgi:hypothetical protein